MLRKNSTIVVSLTIKLDTRHNVDNPVEQSDKLTLQQSSTYAFLSRYGSGAKRSSECALSHALH